MKLKQIKRNFKKMDATSRAFIKGASAMLIIQILAFILCPTVIAFCGIIHTFSLIGMFVFQDMSVRINRYSYYLKGQIRDGMRKRLINISLN
ncbi:hypothetical protein [Bacteroides heparinolyticus]|uniref:hypothetical protein n=1 Tax=Prevotella heparinolytica TaxID=28113 RepID=UPI0023F4AD37|nr:hypothetical protein [Bacteroides heparinolyticus]